MSPTLRHAGFLLSALLLHVPAGAIVLNDAAALAAGGMGRYFDQGNTFPNVVSLYGAYDTYVGSSCTGSLINARSILTAAHCVADSDNRINSTIQRGRADIRFGPEAYFPSPDDRRISGVLSHADYNGDNDIALISLDRPVATLPAVKLIQPGQPLPPVGSIVRMVGYGAHGTGSGPPDEGDGPYDDRRRVGDTIYEGYIADPDSGPQPYLRGKFRDPDDPGSLPLPPLQAGAAPGDSGGPLFLVAPQGLVQIGIATFVASSGKLPYGYGSITGWTSVADYMDWIAANNPLRQLEAVAGEHVWSSPASWFDPYGAQNDVPDNRHGSAGDTGVLGRYFDVLLSAPGTMTLDMNASIDRLSIEASRARLRIPAGHGLDVEIGSRVSAGELRVDGRLGTRALGLTGGTLSGSGAIRLPGGEYVVNNGGTVAPGHADGRRSGDLAIVGGYRQEPGGILAIRMNGEHTAALLVADSAHIDGGTLSVMPGEGLVAPLAQTDVLRAGRGLTGRFDSVTSSFAFLDGTVVWNDAVLRVKLARNDTSFAALARTDNEKGAAEAIDRQGWSNPAFQAIASATGTDSYSREQASRAYNQLSGEIHPSVQTALLEQGRYVRAAALARASGVSTAGMASNEAVSSAAADDEDNSSSRPRLEGWSQALGSWGHAGSAGGAAAMGSSAGGLLMGMDHEFAPGARAGLLAGYSRTTLSVDGRRSSASVHSYHLGAYGAAQTGPVALRFGASHAWHRVATQRHVAFPLFAGSADAGYDAKAAQAFGELAYGIEHGPWKLEPFAGLSYTRLDAAGFSEQGSAAALSGERTLRHAVFSSTGLHSQRTWEMDDATLELYSTVAWQHAFGAAAANAVLRFNGAGEGFNVSGLPLTRDALLLSIGLEWSAGNHRRFQLGYAGQLSARAQDHAIQAKLNWQF